MDTIKVSKGAKSYEAQVKSRDGKKISACVQINKNDGFMPRVTELYELQEEKNVKCVTDGQERDVELISYTSIRDSKSYQMIDMTILLA